MKYADKLGILRLRVPVGLKDGLAMLEKANGDVDQAEELFKLEMRVLVISKTGVTDDVATKHLIENNFDINLALNGIYEENHSLTERILRRFKDKEWALETLHSVVVEKNNLIRKPWPDFDGLQALSPEVFCLLTVYEWLCYSDYEGLDIAIYSHCDVVADQMERLLLVPEIAQTIRKAKEIHESQINIKKEGWHTPEFSEQNDLFNEQKPLLIDSLYEFVKTNMDKFP